MLHEKGGRPAYYLLSLSLQNNFGDHHFNEDYVKVVQAHADVVVTQIFGHTHTDTFRIDCDGDGAKCVSALLAPSLTPVVSG